MLENLTDDPNITAYQDRIDEAQQQLSNLIANMAQVFKPDDVACLFVRAAGIAVTATGTRELAIQWMRQLAAELESDRDIGPTVGSA